MRQFNSNTWPVLSTTAVDYVLLKDVPLYPLYPVCAYRDSRTQLEKAIAAYIDCRIKLKLNGLRPVQYRIQTVQIAKFLFLSSFQGSLQASGSQNFVQLLHKVADHDGLGQKAVHAAFQRVAAVLVKGVGGHGKDRQLCPRRVVQWCFPS